MALRHSGALSIVRAAAAPLNAPEKPHACKVPATAAQRRTGSTLCGWRPSALGQAEPLLPLLTWWLLTRFPRLNASAGQPQMRKTNSQMHELVLMVCLSIAVVMLSIAICLSRSGPFRWSSRV